VVSPKFAFFEGKIVPYADAKISILTHALNYGTAAFGGIRGYWNEDNEQLYLFRPLDHFHRLLNSAKLLAMELHDLQEEISIVSLPFGRYVANDTNAHVTFSSWRRIDDNVIPARGKISGAYANSAFIKTDALRSGFDEALVLTQSGHLSEGSAENVFMIRDGALITPPITDNVLEGITRRSVMELTAKELELPVIERHIDRTEVYLCDELFLTGTAAQVTAVTHVDHRAIGSGVMGPVTQQLRAIFDDVVRGRHRSYQAWNTPVYKK